MSGGGSRTERLLFALLAVLMLLAFASVVGYTLAKAVPRRRALLVAAVESRRGTESGASRGTGP